MRRALYLAVTAGLLGMLSAHAPVATAAPDDHKVVICHVPPGNPENAHTIVVDYHAVPAHLEHGDFIGACEAGGSGPM